MHRDLACAASVLALLAGTSLAHPAAAQADPPDAVTVVPLAKAQGVDGQLDTLRQALTKAETGSTDLHIDQETAQGSRVVSFDIGGKTYQVLTIPTDRLKALTLMATRKIESDSKVTPSVLQELRAPFAAARTPAFEGLGEFSPRLAAVFAPMQVQGGPKALQVNQSFALALEGAHSMGINLNLNQLERLPATRFVSDMADRRPALAPFATRYKQTIDAIKGVLNAPGEPTAAVLRKSAQATEQAYVESWPRLRNDPDARRLAVRALDGLAGQSALKAVYGVSSSFPPREYRDIHQQSARAVAIATNNGKVVCSGVAVSAEWMMTAGHCFAGQVWQTMRVIVPQADGAAAPAAPILQQWPSPAPGSRGADAIDYVFVRIAPTAALTVPAPCLAETPADFQDAVLVIGYASDVEELVYDHAYVWFPFQPYTQEFLKVEAMTGARLQRLAEAFHPGSLERQETFIQGNLKSFDQAYRTTVPSATGPRREYRGRATDITTDRPMLGFDTDTVSGNSGGPVYGRGDKLCIVGVFSGGQPDNVQIDEGTWKEHEFATPMSAVLSDLAKRDPAIIADPIDRAAVFRLKGDIDRLRQ